MTLTLDTLFDAAGFSPNPAQREAILHTHGPLFLVAGPGSGKTRVLLWRTLNLLVFHGVDPSQIFLSTFTEKAAQQLKDGLLSLLTLVTRLNGRTFDLSKMYVGTVHSLCHRMLEDRAFSPGRARLDIPTVMDALDQYFHLASNGFWREARKSLEYPGEVEALRADVNAFFENAPTPSKHKAVANLLTLFNRFSEENLSPQTLLEQVEPENQLLAQLYNVYRQRLGHKRVDLALLQQAAHQVISASEQATSVFQYVIVDEYQDTNAIQERIFFRLAATSQNLCVVGDDDQALYRFRGATVENFVQFPQRCQQYLGALPQRIALNTNYRSRREIVDFYVRFMEQTDWRRPDAGHYRLHDKDIRAHSTDQTVSVVSSTSAAPEQVAEEVAALVRRLVDEKRVADPNQVAFLFPSLKSKAVERMQHALEKVGLKVYAPRAKRFLEADEPSAMIGLLGAILGRPPRNDDFDRGEYREFHNWLDDCSTRVSTLIKGDARLALFVKDRVAELATVRKDYAALMKVMETFRTSQEGWTTDAPYVPQQHKRPLLNAAGLSERARRAIGTAYLDQLVVERQQQGKPVTL